MAHVQQTRQRVYLRNDFPMLLLARRGYEETTERAQSLQRPIVKVLNIGQMSSICIYCKAFHYLNEGLQVGNAFEGIKCCRKQKVLLPGQGVEPPELLALFTGTERTAREFRTNIRVYNNALAFASMRSNQDRSISYSSGGIYTFRVSGEISHRFGELIPSEAPKFAQVYFYEGCSESQDGIGLSVDPPSVYESLNLNVLEILRKTLLRVNPYAARFRQLGMEYMQLNEDAREEFCLMRLHLIEKRGYDRRRFNIPSTDEVAALINEQDAEIESPRSLVVYLRTSTNREFNCNSSVMRTVKDTSCLYAPLHYVLLFPNGEDGYSIGMELQRSGNVQRRHSRVSQLEFYSSQLHMRENGSKLLFLGGRLFQQYLVDIWVAIESSRLRFLRANQKQLRAELYQGFVDTVADDLSTRAEDIGVRIVLPSSFHGGPRDLMQQFQDAMCIVRTCGRPDFFITFTCNPSWVEITSELLYDQTPQDRPDLVSRVFALKLKELIKDLKGGILGRYKAVVYTIEFQKRGLPHAHILLIVDGTHKLMSPEAYDTAVSAEIPSPLLYPELHAAVVRHMIHGPNCEGQNNSVCGPCLDENGKCRRRFPKPFHPATTESLDEYPIYKRQNNGAYNATKKGVPVDNRWVVPYNPYLLKKYDAHLNVEICSSIAAVKYLFKYIYKGPDRVIAVMELDEIKRYVNARYVGPSEAAARIFEQDLHYRDPPVQRLQIHEENQQSIVFDGSLSPEEILQRENIGKTMLTEFFEANRVYPELANSLLYTEFPSKFVWNITERVWKPRKRGSSIGRLIFVSPKIGEKYFLRLLLTVRRGPTSFEDVRTVQGIVWPTFKDACMAMGLLEDDQEWSRCLSEASLMKTGRQLRELFACILGNEIVNQPSQLWMDFIDPLSDDLLFCLQGARWELDSSEAIHFLTTLKHYANELALDSLRTLLRSFGRDLSEFDGMEEMHYLPCFMAAQSYLERAGQDEVVTTTGLGDPINVWNEYSTDTASHFLTDARALSQTLTQGQEYAFSTVTASVLSRQSPKLFFLDGPGGCGKTYLENVLLKHLRGSIAMQRQGQEPLYCIAVATSGIASMLLDEGATAHSVFKIPLLLNEHSICHIGKQTKLGRLIRQLLFVIWDEAPMAHRFAIEAVDRTFRDIRDDNRPFGGVTVLFAGDFRQIPPVVQRGERSDIVGSSFANSVLYQLCDKLRLSENMRVEADEIAFSAPGFHRQRFTEWLLDVGEGHTGIHTDLQYLRLPSSMTLIGVNSSQSKTDRIGNDIERYGQSSLLHSAFTMLSDSSKYDLAHTIYKDLADNAFYLRSSSTQIEYFLNRSILTPKNEDVDGINDFILQSFRGEEMLYYGADSMDLEGVYQAVPIEYLNSLIPSGMPPQRLRLKVGVPIMLLRNIFPKLGLFNGTRLIVSKLNTRVIEGIVMSGKFRGTTVLIPRMTLETGENISTPVPFRRRQLPIKLAFAMTINKSQGQSFQRLTAFLPRGVFSHGQLYVALSRAMNAKHLKVFLTDSTESQRKETMNIVWPELLKH